MHGLLSGPMLGPMPHDDEVTAPAAAAGPAEAGAAAPVGEGALLWAPGPGERAHARVAKFMSWLTAARGIPLHGYDELWRWSVERPAEFWDYVWDFFDVPGRGEGPALTGGLMPDVRWFPGASVNYARAALRTAWRTRRDRGDLPVRVGPAWHPQLW